MPADPNILRAARVLLGLSQDELAEAARISKRSLARLEAGEFDPLLSTIETVKLALEERGVVFLGPTESSGPGLRVSGTISFGWEDARAQVARRRERRGASAKASAAVTDDAAGDAD
ncbi:helix-turn-helix transcriptional regulator [Antarcticirhabdus aurantiaca]|nr:helix-turn-helix domain-containing protein [Antarcticirhabdus aurantiaca]